MTDVDEPMSEDLAAVRDALAVVQTSVHLIRRHLGDSGLTNLYLEKHFSRIDDGVQRAVLALAGK